MAKEITTHNSNPFWSVILLIIFLILCVSTIRPIVLIFFFSTFSFRILLFNHFTNKWLIWFSVHEKICKHNRIMHCINLHEDTWVNFCSVFLVLISRVVLNWLPVKYMSRSFICKANENVCERLFCVYMLCCIVVFFSCSHDLMNAHFTLMRLNVCVEFCYRQF